MTIRGLSVFGMLVLGSATTLSATQVGEILVCYACQNTGNGAIDAALGTPAGKEVAGDGILFAFVNTSGSAITGGTFSVTNASPNDSFVVPTIAAGSTFIFIPGVTSDSGTHPAAGLFALTGVMDTSDGDGGVTDSSIFKFTGLDSGSPVSSTTAGTSTGIAGTFTPGDPGLFMPYRDNPSAGTTSFIGDGPSGDGGCLNCYFGVVATLNTRPATTSPEPQTVGLLAIGLLLSAGLRRRLRAIQ